jgi:hypothetical protein
MASDLQSDLQWLLEKFISHSIADESEFSYNDADEKNYREGRRKAARIVSDIAAKLGVAAPVIPESDF